MLDSSVQPAIDMQKEPEAWFWTRVVNPESIHDHVA
jgi:GTP cyclohydrolase FolE2